jgi:hypothetical protein
MKKLFFFLAIALPCAVQASNVNDTTFTYNNKKIVVTDDSVNTRVAIYDSTKTALKKSSESTFVNDQEVERIYVTSPFIPKRRAFIYLWGSYPAIYIGRSILPSHVFGFHGRDDMYTNDSRSNEIGFSLFYVGCTLNNTGTLYLTSALQTALVYCHFNKHYKYDNVDGKSVMLPIESDSKLKESYIHYGYVRVPLMIEWRPQNTNSKFFIGAGMSFEMNTGMHSRYKTSDGRHSVTKDLNVNPFGVGLDAHIGYGNVSIYIHSDITPLFNTGRAPRCFPLSIGWGLGF